MKKYIDQLGKKENLQSEAIAEVMHAIMSGKAAKDDVGAFLLALRAKGATVSEIVAAAKVMRHYAVGITSRHQKILDTCGTGGDRKHTFNISTAAALVVAGAGCAVAKHGNRSVSSRCGSADVLEALGVNLNLNQQQLGDCLDSVGLVFLFAQHLHPAMKNVAPVRKELGVETIFNILGPLTNPAGATHQMIGVYSRDLIVPLAEVLRDLGARRALVVHGSDGLDEITLTGKSFLCEFTGSEIRSYNISPEELGLTPASLSDITGGDLSSNVRIIRDVLDGKKGPCRDIVLLNAAYALYIAEESASIVKALERAASSIDTGHAAAKLAELIEFTHSN